MSETKKFKVLVTHLNVPRAGIAVLEEKCDILFCEGLPHPTRDEVLTKSKGVDGILWVTDVHVDAEALDAAGPQLKAISAKSAGVDHIDVNEVTRRGIRLGHTPSVVSNATADFAIGLMIAASRRFLEGYKKIEQFDWEQENPTWMLGTDIQESTIGIVGLGGIGQTIAKRLSGFDVQQILYCGHNEKPEGKKFGAEFVSFDELLRRSDFVFVSCPLTSETRGMFDRNAFAKMKPLSVLINIARGDIVVQDDLIDALKNKQIFAAGLDVMSPEPLPNDHPLIKLDNCILAPHLGSATYRTRDKMAVAAAQNLINALEGKQMIYPLN